jgi:hypothetical protein
MKKILLTTTVFAFAATMAAAAITSQDVVDELTAQDYTVTEVHTGATQIKVEAVKGDQKIEMVYDIETGSVLRSETQTLLNAGTSGETTSYSTSGSDDNGLEDDDNGDDDNGDDNGDDDNGDDDNGDDDNGDDNGGDNHDDGGDHDGGDDNDD